MSFDRQSLKITWGFTVPPTDEIGITGLTVAGVPGWTGAVDAREELEAGSSLPVLLGALLTMVSAGPFQWASYSNLSWVKVAAVGTDGLYLADPGNPSFYEDTPPTAGTTGNVLPQSTVVVSLRTGSTLGRANYGRMYIPHTKIGQAAGSPVGDPTQTASCATQARNFLNAVDTELNATLTDPVDIVNMSAVGTGTTKPVTEVWVGNVTDTQRRRRNRIPEAYSALVL